MPAVRASEDVATDAEDVAPVFHSRPNVVLFVVMFQTFIIMISFSFITVVLPTIQKDFNVPASSAVWVLIMPSLVDGMLSIPFGRLSDLYDRKTIYLAGVFFHIASMFISATAPSIGILIFARALAGLGGAMEGSSGTVMAMSVFPKSKRGVVLGYSQSVQTLAASFGAVIGGLLTKFMSWQTVFFCQAPLAIIMVPIAIWTLPRFNEPGRSGWLSVKTLSLVGASILLTPFLLYHQGKKQKNAVLPVFFIFDSIIGCGFAVKSLFMTVFYGTIVLIPYYLESVKGKDTFTASLFVLSRPLLFAIIGFSFSKILCVRMNRCATTLVIGTVLTTVPIAMFAFGLDNSHWEIVIITAVSIQGIAAGLFFPTVSSAGVSRVDEADIGAYNGLSHMLALMCNVFATSVFMSIIATAEGGVKAIGGYNLAFGIALGVSVLAIFLAFRLYYLLRRLPKAEGGWGLLAQQEEVGERAVQQEKKEADRMEAGVALQVDDGTEQEALRGSFFHALRTSIVTFVDADDKTAAAADSRVSAYMETFDSIVAPGRVSISDI